MPALITHKIFKGRMLFLATNQQRQSTEGKIQTSSDAKYCSTLYRTPARFVQAFNDSTPSCRHTYNPLHDLNHYHGWLKTVSFDCTLFET